MQSLHGDGLQVILKTWNELHKGYTETKPTLLCIPELAETLRLSFHPNREGPPSPGYLEKKKHPQDIIRYSN